MKALPDDDAVPRPASSTGEGTGPSTGQEVAREPRRGGASVDETDRSTLSAPPRTITIYDVAQRAGVGIATVSRALRGSAPVAAATRAKILHVVEELGYRPSYLGTSLAEHRHAANGIVFPDLSGPYYAEVVLGHEEAASRLGRSVLIQSTHGRTDPDGAARELAGRVDGLVLLGRTVQDAMVEEIVATGLPVVLLARPAVHGADSLRVDNFTAARALGAHLGAHQFRTARFLGSPHSSHDVAERWAGIFQGLADAGTRLDLTPCDLDEESGTRVAREVLARASRPDALVCANDEIALGAILAAEEAGLRVGVDVAITGWDDIMAARHARPALTTVRQPMRLLGAHAAKVLDERISRTRTSPLHEVLPAYLVVRSSCGSHPTRRATP